MSSRTYEPTGTVHAAENSVQFWPRLKYDKQRRGVIYLHGSTASAVYDVGAGGFGLPTLLGALADYGYPILACDFGGSPYSNFYNDAEGIPRITEGINYAQATLGFKPGKVHLLGASMGNIGALRWAIANPTLVASIAGVIPVYDVQAARVNNVTLRGQIDTAWSVTYPAALPAGASPVDNIATINGVIPWKGWYSSDDEADFVTGAAALATALGGTATSLGALGHTDAAIGAAPAKDIAAFFASRDA